MSVRFFTERGRASSGGSSQRKDWWLATVGHLSNGPVWAAEWERDGQLRWWGFKMQRSKGCKMSVRRVRNKKERMWSQPLSRTQCAKCRQIISLFKQSLGLHKLRCHWSPGYDLIRPPLSTRPWLYMTMTQSHGATAYSTASPGGYKPMALPFGITSAGSTASLGHCCVSRLQSHGTAIRCPLLTIVHSMALSDNLSNSQGGTKLWCPVPHSSD
jgi:hypothetical protein